MVPLSKILHILIICATKQKIKQDKKDLQNLLSVTVNKRRNVTVSSSYML